MKSLKLLTVLSVLALAPVAGAFAGDDSSSGANNPNCSPGVKGCFANSATSDVSKDNPTKNAEISPNCSPGEKGCSANYPTSDVTKQAPSK